MSTLFGRLRVRSYGSSLLVSSVALNTLDQALYSLSNAGLTILVASTSSADNFGDFVLAATFFMLAVALTRAIVNQPFMMRFGEDNHPSVRSESALGAALVIGSIGAVISTFILLFSTSDDRLLPLVIVGYALPALIIQDALRTVLVVSGFALRAVINDLLWAVVQFGLVMAVIFLDDDSPSRFTLAWVCGGLVAAVVGLLLDRLRPSMRGAITYLRQNIDISAFMLVEAAVVMGAAQAVLILIGLVASPAELGALRGAQTLLGPLNIIGFGVIGALVPELVRRARSGWSGHSKIAISIAVGLTSINIVWGALLLLLPRSVGTTVLGDTWDSARDAILPMTVFFASVAAGNPALAVIRSLGQVRRSFRVYLVLAPLTLALPLLGQLRAGAVGAAWGLAVASCSVLPIWWWQMRKALEARSEAQEPESVSDP